MIKTPFQPCHCIYKPKYTSTQFQTTDKKKTVDLDLRKNRQMRNFSPNEQNFRENFFVELIEPAVERKKKRNNCQLIIEHITN